jgi:hypothetical protein
MSLTITTELKPEIERAAGQAAARGMGVAAHAAMLLEQAAQAEEPQSQDITTHAERHWPSGRKTRAELRRIDDRLNRMEHPLVKNQ